MTRPFLPNVATLLLVPFFALSQDTESESSTTTTLLRWGAAVSGLQMAVLVEPQAGFIHCWIRNWMTNEITYNRHFLGYFDSVGIEYREGPAWKRLRRDPSQLRYMTGAGPFQSELERLPPLQVITNGQTRDWAKDRFGPRRIAVTNRLGTIWGPERRTEVPGPTQLGATFGVDLGDFVWPQGALIDSATEVRIFQQLSGPGHEMPITLWSVPVRLETQALQAFLERLRHGRK